MYITNYFMSHKTSDTFDTLADDRGTKMSYMKWFCNIRSAVVDDDRLWLLCCIYRVFRICCHLTKIFSKKFFLYAQIDKSGFYNLCYRKNIAVFQKSNHIICNHKRSFLIRFGTSHCSIALIFAKIRSVGNRHLTVFRIISGFFKSRSKFLCH